MTSLLGKSRHVRWWLADRLRPNAWPSTASQHAALLEQIKEQQALRREAVDALNDLVFEGRIDGLDVDGKAALNDPTGSLARAANVLRDADDA